MGVHNYQGNKPLVDNPPSTDSTSGRWVLPYDSGAHGPSSPQPSTPEEKVLALSGKFDKATRKDQKILLTSAQEVFSTLEQAVKNDQEHPNSTLDYVYEQIEASRDKVFTLLNRMTSKYVTAAAESELARSRPLSDDLLKEVSDLKEASNLECNRLSEVISRLTARYQALPTGKTKVEVETALEQAKAVLEDASRRANAAQSMLARSNQIALPKVEQPPAPPKLELQTPGSKFGVRTPKQ